MRNPNRAGIGQFGMAYRIAPVQGRFGDHFALNFAVRTLLRETLKDFATVSIVRT